jgi:hypothetical protein
MITKTGKNILTRLCIPLCVTLVLFASCRSPFSPDFAQAGGGEGFLTLNIGGTSLGRTILPATVANSYAVYSLKFYLAGNTGAPDKQLDRSGAEAGQQIKLAAGVWNVQVSAWLDAEKTREAARGSYEGITITQGGTASAEVRLQAIIEAGTTGTFTWNIGYDESVISASMTISPLDSVTGSAERTGYFIGGEPLMEKNNSLTLNAGYYWVLFSLSNGKNTVGRRELLHIYGNLESRFDYQFDASHFAFLSVSQEGDGEPGTPAGPGTLRYVMEHAPAFSSILIEDNVKTILLQAPLEIESKSLTIRGSGTVISRDPAWTSVSESTPLLRLNGGDVIISRVHFKDGRAAGRGAAIKHESGDLTLESCIFSGNQNTGRDEWSGGGAINLTSSGANLYVKGCTFYNNYTADSGGAIINKGGAITLAGTVFYGNRAGQGNGTHVIASGEGGSVVSQGYNVAGLPAGTGDNTAHFTQAAGDVFSVSSLPMHPVSFRPFPVGGATGIITTLPTGYPAADFYGKPLPASGAHAGAVQAVTANKYYLELSANNTALSSAVKVTGVSEDADEPMTFDGEISLAAIPPPGYSFSRWLINNVPETANPHTFTPNAHVTVQAEFSRSVGVSILSDEAGSETTPGTLRHALVNMEGGDIISFTGITAGSSTLELRSGLPEINKSISIEGNGVVMTRHASWTALSDTSQLLRVSGGQVNISRVHFKDGRSSEKGAGIRQTGGSLVLESCIFSGNHNSTPSTGGRGGGAIRADNSTLTIRGCTFYQNSVNNDTGGAMYTGYTDLELTGNVFYGNTCNYTPALHRGTVDTDHGSRSGNYNVSDKLISSGYSASSDTLPAFTPAASLPFSPQSFKPIRGRAAVVEGKLPASLPVHYPAYDFYGKPIAASGAAGAAKEPVPGFMVSLSSNNAAYGSAAVLNANSDGVYSGTIQIEAAPNPEKFAVLDHWLVNGVNSGSLNPLSITIDADKTVQAVFRALEIETSPAAGGSASAALVSFAGGNYTVSLSAAPAPLWSFLKWEISGGSVPESTANPLTLTLTAQTRAKAFFKRNTVSITSLEDGAASETTPGTLRHALANLVEGDNVLEFSGITPGQSVLMLTRPLPAITQNTLIRGNGVTITRDAAWTALDSPLLGISGGTVSVSRVHFKDGECNSSGGGMAGYQMAAAVRQSFSSPSSSLTLESCIFSGNRTSGQMSIGGAIYSAGNLTLRGCTFYGNQASAYYSESAGGAVYKASGSFNLTGNVFFGNSGGDYPVIFNSAVSGGFNLADRPSGTGSGQSGFNFTGTDAVINSVPFHPLSFKNLFGSASAGRIIGSLPPDYPALDFYGQAITLPAASGAVQETLTNSEDHLLLAEPNRNGLGSVVITPASPDGLYSGPVTLTANPAASCLFSHWTIVEGADIIENPYANSVTVNVSGPLIVQAVFYRELPVSNLSDEDGSETTPGTLRYALTNSQPGDVISFTGITAGLSTVELQSALPLINHDLTIEGNGVVITRHASWTDVSQSSQLLNIGQGYSSSYTAKISRMHFKNGRASNSGAAIRKRGGNLTLESCIFSGNRHAEPGNGGGAVYQEEGTLTVTGCTFYDNHSLTFGGAIHNNWGTLKLAGNLFYGNTAAGSANALYGTVTSQGYNVVDISLGSNGSIPSGTSGDKAINSLPLSPVRFRPITGGGADSVISGSLPAGYPETDFYGQTITLPASAGAVQTQANGKYLNLSVNSASLGSVTITPAPDDDWVFTGPVSLTAAPADGYLLDYWRINGTRSGNNPTLNLTMENHTTVYASFAKVQTVSILNDNPGSAATQGTLRYALANQQDGDLIRFTGVTAGSSSLELRGVLPDISKNITIEGNGVTITRHASWTEVNAASQLLRIAGGSATISRVHFKNGLSGGKGAGLQQEGGSLTLESCVFSGNHNSVAANYNSSGGGALYLNNAQAAIRGCTFYNNSVNNEAGGMLYALNTTLEFTGNISYGNTSAAYPPPDNRSAAYRSGGSSTGDYNVSDIAFNSAGINYESITAIPISPLSFRLLSAAASGAAKRIAARPANYPTADFYNVSIPASNAAAGAAQSVVSGVGYYLDISVNYASFGAVSVSPAPNAEGIYPLSITLTAVPAAPNIQFVHWLLNGEKAGTNPVWSPVGLSTGAKVQAVFNRLVQVTNLSDATGAGSSGSVTLRYALSNALDGDLISFAGITPGESTLELQRVLPEINKNITIEGNGVVITRHASWTSQSETSQLLRFSGGAVTIRRVHFKDGRSSGKGAGVRQTGGSLVLESCIFSGNQNSTTTAGDRGGGAIKANNSTLAIRGCTFYQNSVSNDVGGAMYTGNTNLELTGNVFYENTSAGYSHRSTVDTDYGSRSGNYNVSDKAISHHDAPNSSTLPAFTITASLPFSPQSFKPISGRAAAGVLPAPLPANYPALDFYGQQIAASGAAGAAQELVTHE